MRLPVEWRSDFGGSSRPSLMPPPKAAARTRPSLSRPASAAAILKAPSHRYAPDMLKGTKSAAATSSPATASLAAAASVPVLPATEPIARGAVRSTTASFARRTRKTSDHRGDWDLANGEGRWILDLRCPQPKRPASATNAPLPRTSSVLRMTTASRMYGAAYKEVPYANGLVTWMGGLRTPGHVYAASHYGPQIRPASTDDELRESVTSSPRRPCAGPRPASPPPRPHSTPLAQQLASTAAALKSETVEVRRMLAHYQGMVAQVAEERDDAVRMRHRVAPRPKAPPVVSYSGLFE